MVFDPDLTLAPSLHYCCSTTSRVAMSMPLPGFPILVADQNELTRWILFSSLSDIGYTVREAQTAAILHATLESGPHLLLLDPILPGTRDLELLATIRRNSPGSRVVLLGRPSSDLKTHASRHGAHGVLEKPFAFEGVLGLVNQLQRVG